MSLMKRIIKSLSAPMLFDAAMKLADSEWMLMINDPKANRAEWVEERAIQLFQELKAEINA